MKNIIQKIYDYTLEDIMGERFGKYSKYIIQDRAIPDVRDGLKPVQRRILYAMYKIKNTHDKPYNKSANAVGEVIGKYHPHGDSSIYDAMVRMSQDWKSNTPLIDMKGNNGSIDGDSPAAYRYTEARLSKISMELLKELDRDTVKHAPNYDDKRLEPTVLPAKFPNLLVNGAMGISAGYATNIPPHNLSETILATIYRIEHPNCSLEDIMKIIPGPDFPTGAIIEGRKGLEEAYQTGRGKIMIRSKYEVQKEKNLTQIVITEIPYDVNKSILVRKMDEIRLEKKIEGINEVRDESAMEGLRIVVDLKKDANAELIINYLLKNTDLQISYNFNMVAIVNRRPKLLGIIEILDAYINHEKEVVQNRCKFDLAHAQSRFHIVEGLMKAISILDDVIATIRSSKNKSDAEKNLQEKYGFTEEQAVAIVTLQLYRLTNTDITTLEKENADLLAMINMLTEILSDEKKLMKVIKNELLKIEKEYGTPRKSLIQEEITEIKIDTTALISKEDVVVVITHDGYVKRVNMRSYKASAEETLVKDGDLVTGTYECNTLDTILLFTNLGNYLYIPVHEIPDLKWRELGKHISNIIPIKPEESIIASTIVNDFTKERYITTFTKNGLVKRTSISEYQVQRFSKPICNIKLKDGDEVVSVCDYGYKNVFICTELGYGLWFDVTDIPLTGVKTGGVKGINLKNDHVASGMIFNSNNEFVIIITDKGTGKRIRLSEFEKMGRARRGIQVIRDVKTNPYYIVSALITGHKEYLVIKTKNDIKEVKTTELVINDRYSTGCQISADRVLYAGLKSCAREEEIEEEITLDNVSIKKIDDQIMTIDDFLKDLDN